MFDNWSNSDNKLRQREAEILLCKSAMQTLLIISLLSSGIIVGVSASAKNDENWKEMAMEIFKPRRTGKYSQTSARQGLSDVDLNDLFVPPAIDLSSVPPMNCGGENFQAAILPVLPEMQSDAKYNEQLEKVS